MRTMVNLIPGWNEIDTGFDRSLSRIPQEVARRNGRRIRRGEGLAISLLPMLVDSGKL